MMKISLRSVAILAALAVTCCVSAMAEKQKHKPPVGRNPPIARIELTDAEKIARMKQVLDARLNPGDPEQPRADWFPEELRLLTILTLDITFSDLFAANGKSISEVVRGMQRNWDFFERNVARRDAYFEQLPFYVPADTFFRRIDNIVLTPLRGSHTTTSWRKLFTQDIEHVYTPGNSDPDKPSNASNRSLFERLRVLSKDGVGGGDIFPLFPFLTLNQKDKPDDNTGMRAKVESLLSSEWLGEVGSLTYYDLFTKHSSGPGYPGCVNPTVACAVQQALGSEYNDGLCSLANAAPVLRVYFPNVSIAVHPWPNSENRAYAGNDCCCQNRTPKSCGPTPDLGCTNMGSPPRCTLGSIACPTACNP